MRSGCVIVLLLTLLSFELLGALNDRPEVHPRGLVALDQPLVAVLLAQLDWLLGARELLAMLRQERSRHEC